MLHDWQDFAGAIVGGILGVIGALVVARSAINRERRTASVMLQRDLLNVTAMIHSLTHHRKVTLGTVGGESLARNLAFFRQRLSPLFEEQMATLSGYDLLLTSLLVGFHQCYAAVENHMRKIETLAADNPEVARALTVLPDMLEYADMYARAALYLLPLQEISALRRWYWNWRRRLRPDQDDLDSQALIKRLQQASPPAQMPGALRA